MAEERTCPQCGWPMMAGPLRINRDGEQGIADWWCADCHFTIWAKES